MGNKPRINLVLIENIRHARMLRSFISGGPPKFCHSGSNAADLPDVSYVTERAKKGGIANAKRGKDMVTAPSDHFGPISAEHDPIMNRGILVGQCFDDRHQCGQWGVHRPPVAGISGQQKYGSQSVVLSGGYVDDEDHGEWFIYTGRSVVCSETFTLSRKTCILLINSKEDNIFHRCELCFLI